MFVFRKIWRALSSCDTHFEICPSALLLTNSTIKLPVISFIMKHLAQVNIFKFKSHSTVKRSIFLSHGNFWATLGASFSQPFIIICDF